MVQETGLFPHDLLRSAIQLRVVKSTTIAALTLVIWDYFILLPDEIALVWPARWSISKFIFLLNRYLAFTDPILLIYVMMFAEDARVCEITFRALGYLAIVGFNIAQIILILRTWAVWGSKLNWEITCLFGLYLCILAIAYRFTYAYLAGVHSMGVPAVGMTGCSLSFANRLAWVPFTIVILIETVLILLLVYKMIQIFRGGRTSLLMIIYRDALFYFACILASAIVNLAVVLLAPIDLHLFLIVIQRVLHSVLCTRVVLHIRGVNQKRANPSNESFPTTGLFAVRTSVVHNEAASVDIWYQHSQPPAWVRSRGIDE